MHIQLKKLKLLAPVFFLILSSLAIIPVQQLFAQSCNAGETLHIISSGENLFRIGLRYGVPFETIASRNGIADVTRIYAGMTLCIPTGGTGSNLNQVVPVIYVTATPSASTSTTTTISNTTNTTTTVQPGHENWCLNGGPWDDGRCIVPGNEALQNYWFFAGWCNAQVQLGNYIGSVDDCLNGRGSMRAPGSSSSASTNSSSSTSSEPDIIATITAATTTTITTFDYDLVDRDGEEFACTVVYDKFTGVVLSLAEWDDEYDDQDQVIFFTDLPRLFNYPVNLGKKDEQAGILNTTDPYKTFSRASASIQLRDDEGDGVGVIGPVDCKMITN